MPRRRRTPHPPLPTNPTDRYLEVKMFLDVLVNDLLDYDHLNVYNSIFRKRVDDYFGEIDFSMTTEEFTEESFQLVKTIQRLGTMIRDTETTKTRDFLDFYRSIVTFMESLQVVAKTDRL